MSSETKIRLMSWWFGNMEIFVCTRFYKASWVYKMVSSKSCIIFKVEGKEQNS